MQPETQEQTVTLTAGAARFIADQLAGSTEPEAQKLAAILRTQATRPEIETIAARLQRPLVFCDLETTGTKTSAARIVELATLKLYPDGRIEKTSALINPMCSIPAEAAAVHGITDQVIEDEAPYSFKELACYFYDIFEGADIAGYNSNSFDVPVLAEEFNRAGLKFPAPGTLLIDVYNIYAKNERRTLADALMLYRGEQLKDAHEALADIEATAKILAAQLYCYPELSNMTPQELHTYSKKNLKAVDLAGLLELNDAGQICWTFGKWQGKPILTDLSYISWFLRSEFPAESKAIVKEHLNR